MRQSSEVRSRIFPVVVLGLVMIVGVSGSAFANPGVAALRRSTAAFHSIDVAMAAGWGSLLGAGSTRSLPPGRHHCC